MRTEPASCNERGLTLIHSTNDARVLAGAATLSLEMLREAPDLDALVVSVGGGSQAVGALTVAQPGGRDEWLLLPQLTRGQEFTYSGWFTEERINAGVRSQSAYRLESTLLVLSGSPGAKKWDVAFLTVLSRRASRFTR